MINSPCLLRLSRQTPRGRQFIVVDDVSEVKQRPGVQDTRSSCNSTWRFGGKLSVLMSCYFYISILTLYYLTVLTVARIGVFVLSAKLWSRPSDPTSRFPRLQMIKKKDNTQYLFINLFLPIASPLSHDAPSLPPPCHKLLPPFPLDSGALDWPRVYHPRPRSGTFDIRTD